MPQAQSAEQLSSGLWVKTHFYREGHMLHAVTYCVAAGNPEVIRLSVDMRPIARAVARYHTRLHEKEARSRTNPDPHVSGPARKHVHHEDHLAQVLDHASPKAIHHIFALEKMILAKHSHLAGGHHPLYEAVSLVVASAADDQASLDALVAALRAHHGKHHRSELYKELMRPIGRVVQRLSPTTVGKGLALSAEWHRNHVDYGHLFHDIQGRWAKPNEVKDLEVYVDKAKNARRILDERQWEHAHSLAEFYIRHLRKPNAAENDALVQRAFHVVDGFDAAYDASHHSLFSDITAPFKGIGNLVQDIAKSKLVSMVADAVGGVVGKVVSITKAISPIGLVEHLVKGERIDHALLADFRDKLAVAHDVAPIVAMIPGLGTGIAAGIAGAAALAEGKPITDVMIEAVRGALPGGQAMQFAVDIAKNVVKGGNVLKSTLEAARNQLPEAARAAFDVGIAVYHGKNLQDAVSQGASALKSGILSHAPVAQALEKYSKPALAAYATAHAAFDAIAKGSDAATAMQKITEATTLLDKASTIAQRLGATKTAEELKVYPALAQKLRRAAAIRAAGAKLSPAIMTDAQSQAQEAMKRLVAIAKTAREDPDPARRLEAQKSIAILQIVADHRVHVKSIAHAHAGGVPGIHIDRHGSLKKGRFTPGKGARDGYLYGPDGGRGDWQFVSEDASTRPTMLEPHVHHAVTAEKHAALAASHERLAKKEPMKAQDHRRQAALHAKKAVAHKAEAVRISGACPPAIGCLPTIVGCPPTIVGCPNS